MSTYEKTYQYIMNQVMDVSSTTNTGKNTAYFIFAALVGTGGYVYKNSAGATIGSPTGLWTIDSMCDGTTAGTAGDGVNRWGTTFTPANQVYAAEGSAHSWAVLHHSGLGLYLVINLTNGTYQASFSVSKTQPTGGTTTNRPKAADEMAPSLWQNINIYPNGGTAKCHIAVATDGNWAGMLTQDGQTYNYSGWFMHQMMDTHAGDLFPHVCYFNYSYSGGGAWVRGQLQGGYAYTRDANNQASYQCGPIYLVDDTGSIWINRIATDFTDGAYDDLPIYWLNTSYPRSIKGRWADYRWSGDNYPNNNTFEPATGQITSLIFGNLWIPAYVEVVF